MEGVRFFVVALAGVLVDITFSYFAAQTLNMPLWMAATIGFSIAAIFNYFAHEMWTFRSRRSCISVRRAFQYVAASVLTLGVRLMIIWLMDAWLDEAYVLTILVCAAGVSFFFNFILSKLVIFGPNKGKHGSS